MNYNNCDKKRKETYKEDSSSQSCECGCKSNYNSNYGCGCSCNCCQPMSSYCSQPPIDYKDSVLTCGGSVTPATTISTVATTPTAVGNISVNANCVKCPSTLLTYNGTATLTGVAAVAIPAGTTITITVSKVCGFNSTPVPVSQVNIPVPAITPTVGATTILPVSFQVCDSQIYNCSYNNCCCNNNCGNFCSYTITATTTVVATTATVAITGNSLTALTSSSSCCGCCC